MTSAEKVQNCMDLGPVRDRSEIPVYPMMLVYPGVVAGMTQKEIVDDPDAWMKALAITFEQVGKPDVCQGNPPGDVVFLMGLEARRPGYELGDNELYQFVEQPRMDHDDYRDIIKNGWMQWYNRYLCTIQHPPITNPQDIGARWMQVGMNAGKVGGFLASQGIQPIHGVGMGPVFDTLSMVRSFEEFCYDLMDEPELIHDVLRRGVPETIGNALGMVEHSPIKRISMYAMRSDANSISPAIFDEFVFPYLKQAVEAFHAAGCKTNIHADGNWLPMLHRFRELPKGSVHLELDGYTDIFKAAELLDGWQSMRGDLTSNMMAFGTPDEVSEYCEKLITELGMKGGFMLGSGCEIPLNCKLENLKAMMDSVRR